MGFTYYHSLILIPLNHAFTFGDFFERLTKKFAHQQNLLVELQTDHQIIIRRNDWELRIALQDNPHAAIEAQEIAKRFVMDDLDRPIVASSLSYLSTSGDPDPKMDHFNEYVFVLETIEQYSGLYILDPDEGQIRKT